MPRYSGKKIRRNREEGKRLLVLAGAAILCAAALCSALAARVYLTALSQDTAQLNTQLAELQVKLRIAEANYAEEHSHYALAEKAGEIELVPPSGAKAQFVNAPKEDMTLCHPGYET